MSELQWPVASLACGEQPLARREVFEPPTLGFEAWPKKKN